MLASRRLELPTRRLSGARFLSFSTEETKQLSVKEITNSESFDSLQHPTVGGLYDPAMGPVEMHDVCATCHQLAVHCPGHMGHISLPLPIYNPLFFPLAYRLLRVMCLCCDHLLSPGYYLHVTRGQLTLLAKGLLVQALELEDRFSSNRSKEGVDSETMNGRRTDEVFDVSSLNDFVEAAIANAGHASSCESAQSKNLTEARHHLVDQFLRNYAQFKQCGNCNAPVRRLKKEGLGKLFIKPLNATDAQLWAEARHRYLNEKERERKKDNGGRVHSLYDRELQLAKEQQYLSALDVRTHLRQLFQNHGDLLSKLISLSEAYVGADLFFLDVIPVPPPKFRPSNFAQGRRYDNPQTTNLSAVLKSAQELRQILKEDNTEEEQVEGKSHVQRVQTAWHSLQLDVACFIDSDAIKFSTKRPSGVRQILEKKEGLFRKHMMGKRVNYAARSVISPDPYINVDEVGIPLVFAQRLTYPQPVTSLNVEEMREAVSNGPLNYPGATLVEREDGTVVRLRGDNAAQRQSLAKQLLTPPTQWNPLNTCKKVHRYLKDGDLLLLNRQPTLHRPSIMGHKARVLKGEKTLRLHYSNCKSYNADFDGDEMNIHFPQNELGRAEVQSVASSNFQYLVPKDGKPLGGLIQDHLVSGVLMTVRGRFFSREDYFQLVFCGLPDCRSRIAFLPPSIWKPQRLWSGKQIVSTILLTLIPADCEKVNMAGQSKVPHKEWKNTKGRRMLLKALDDTELSESEVIVREGELLCGVLDKSQIGATQFGIVHCCYEGNQKRTRLLNKAADIGPTAAANAFDLSDDTDIESLEKAYQTAHHNNDNIGMKELDFSVKGKLDLFTEDINKAVIPDLMKKFPHNCLQLMTHAGAKGSVVNCMQISCLLGQIELEGRRPCLMPSGRSLPSFLPYDVSPRAGGFVGGRFLTGIRPQEYFFHCMAGREGLIDTAVKTSRSGYLQRCLIKHMEALKVGYDQTVRDGDGSVIQFLYGDDGLDVTKTRFMSKKQLPFIAQNYKAFLPHCNPDAVLRVMDTRKALKHQAKVDRWNARHGGRPKGKSFSSGFCIYSKMHLPELREKIENADSISTKKGNIMHRTKTELKLIESWYSLGPPGWETYRRRSRACPDPTLSRYSPARYFGSVSENLEDLLDDYVQNNTDKLLCDAEPTRRGLVQKGKFSTMVELKFMRSLTEPGESVGLLASQSIGEPSTQMTLNTFHFAGRGEMNVTLGIPRLREILMVASVNIKTPTMEVPIMDSIEAQNQCVWLQKELTRVALSQVIEQVDVWESLSRLGSKASTRRRIYRIRFHFFAFSHYENELAVTPDDIINYVEQKFLKILVKAVQKQMKIEQKRRVNAIHNAKATDKQSLNAKREDVESQNDDDELSEGELGDDADANEIRSRQKKQQLTTYDDPDQDEEEIICNLDDEALDDTEDKSEGNSLTTGSSDDVSYLDNESLLDVSDDDESQSRGQWAKKQVDRGRVMAVLEKSSHIISYDFDSENHLWCEASLQFPVQDSKLIMTSLIENIAERAVIHETPGIKRCFIQQEEGRTKLVTEGVNIQELWQYPFILNLSKFYTNSVHSMASNYGIEAARSILIKEIQSVFKVYGIEVDPRHLSLIADYMCFSGVYRPLNRLGIESNTSPFQKMSYETTIQFLKNATLNGEMDRMESPSSCLVCGRIVPVGTGSCELLHNLSI
ncbi:DNA-directed RNA polymerase I subunit RPA1-like isoform X2 [Corticium candelabrum]|uniref:DNA-directed RNA polymerase I subunit RPA1-like isoform X2 n=1 Tax=Corticium candelabrum TaxID=121492 RepID=UPI002E25D533|nr:DNA-directed RNA polymerase I subunit RPA1-like isoform X2 [Corticium candelabrum]